MFPCLVSLQLGSLRIRLDEREDLLKQKEKKLISVSSEHSENSYAVDNLQSLLVTKERQITSLKLKVIQKTFNICTYVKGREELNPEPQIAQVSQPFPNWKIGGTMCFWF